MCNEEDCAMEGSCVCGKIKFKVMGEIPKLYQCHCTLCQKQTGTASVTACFIDIDNFKWLTGESEVSSYRRESGYRSDFCKYCGAAVPNIFRSGDKVWVPAGAFNESIDAKVTDHIFVKYKAKWDEIGGDAIQHEEFHSVYT